jgi:hypothetical protein
LNPRPLRPELAALLRVLLVVAVTRYAGGRVRWRLVVDVCCISAVGGVSGHLAKGLSRSQAKQADFIDPSQAGLVVVGESKVKEAVPKAVTRDIKEAAENLDGDPKDCESSRLMSPGVTPGLSPEGLPSMDRAKGQSLAR